MLAKRNMYVSVFRKESKREKKLPRRYLYATQPQNLSAVKPSAAAKLSPTDIINIIITITSIRNGLRPTHTQQSSGRQPTAAPRNGWVTFMLINSLVWNVSLQQHMHAYNAQRYAEDLQESLAWKKLLIKNNHLLRLWQQQQITTAEVS